jgi:hypothetical protein
VTPNTNHAGFYVAAMEGLYERASAGLDVELRSPDRYSVDNAPLHPITVTVGLY